MSDEKRALIESVTKMAAIIEAARKVKKGTEAGAKEGEEKKA